MSSAPYPPHVDTATLLALRQKVDDARREFESAADCDKTKSLLRLDKAVNDLTDALLYGRINE